MRHAASRGAQSPRRLAKRLKQRASATLCFRAQWHGYRLHCCRRALREPKHLFDDTSPLEPSLLQPSLRSPEKLAPQSDSVDMILLLETRCQAEPENGSCTASAWVRVHFAWSRAERPRRIGRAWRWTEVLGEQGEDLHAGKMLKLLQSWLLSVRTMFTASRSDAESRKKEALVSVVAGSCRHNNSASSGITSSSALLRAGPASARLSLVPNALKGVEARFHHEAREACVWS